MIKTSEKTELNQISLTGMRALVLLGLLMEAPRTLEEIRDVFKELNVMEDSNSSDILRIDLNTLRTMGCEITKANAKTKYRYVLTKHPFTLNITSEEISTLKKVYKKIKNSSNLLLILKYDELFKKLANYIGDNNVREELYGISALKNYEINLINDLLDDCKENKLLKLTYLSVPSKEAKEKEITALKLVYQNDKIYLYGYDHQKQESVVLNIKRIKSILSRIIGSKGIDVKTTRVKFFLKSFGVTEIQEGETITETSEDGFTVEGVYHNEFLAIQRILSFGSDCTVIEPEEFREKIIQKLKSMRKIYHE